jgi:Ca-activated chloride channel family protein
VRRFIQNGQLPPAGVVRIEEMINYFTYDYPQPVNDDPFSVKTEIAECPWNNSQVGFSRIAGQKIPVEKLPPSNLVFLIDVSALNDPFKLPLAAKRLCNAGGSVAGKRTM